MNRIQLDNTKQIIAVSYSDGALDETDGIEVKELPPENPLDYRYINGEYIVSLRPEPEPPVPPQPTDTETRLKALEDELTATKIIWGVE